MRKLVLFLLIILTITQGCVTPAKVSNQNLSKIYKKEAFFIHPQFTVFHHSDNASRLYFKINSDELLYSRQHDGVFKARVTIAYRLSPSYEAKEIIDSSSVQLMDDTINNSTEKYLLGNFDFRALNAETYLLEVTVTDMNRNQHSKSYLNINKSNSYSAQNFLVSSQSTGIPIFNNYIPNEESISIRFRNKDYRKLYGTYYKREFPIAAPPFSLAEHRPFKYEPDSSFVLHFNDSNKVNFLPDKKGLFHFQADSVNRDGLTLFRFSNDFPELKSIEDLVQPLVYITSKLEYEELTASSNKKAALDNFWLTCAGNPDRAKEIIRKFYNRVQDANSFFTSYHEGWKTDRGMIYIVYGSPNVIYKTSNSESWVYGEENNFMSLTYTFIKAINPFSDNDFVLDRSSVYKNSWYRAVDIWRQGRVYMEN